MKLYEYISMVYIINAVGVLNVHDSTQLFDISYQMH